MDTQEEPLLSELCRICNTNTTKYCCPACSTRTCSLACSKRHKLWSQCTGVRDPTAYVKRNDLATPAGIDRDFNFLVGIERHLESVEKDVEQRGIDIDPAEEPKPWARRKPLQKGEANINAAIARCRVTVERAPKGMQRSRENKTHWNKKHKCISWTVEWVDAANTRRRDSVLETSTLQSAHDRYRSEQERIARKEKLDHDDTPQDAPASPSKPARSTRDPVDSKAPHFYLLKPHTRSTKRVLIPLSAKLSLSASLADRTVLEFPTVYRLDHGPAQLPDGFMSEAQYLGVPEPDAELAALLMSAVSVPPAAATESEARRAESCGPVPESSERLSADSALAQPDEESAVKVNSAEQADAAATTPTGGLESAVVSAEITASIPDMETVSPEAVGSHASK